MDTIAIWIANINPAQIRKTAIASGFLNTSPTIAHWIWEFAIVSSYRRGVSVINSRRRQWKSNCCRLVLQPLMPIHLFIYLLTTCWLNRRLLPPQTILELIRRPRHWWYTGTTGALCPITHPLDTIRHLNGVRIIPRERSPRGDTNTGYRACIWMDGWMNQAYSRLSTTHGHITDCKLVCMYWRHVYGTTRNYLCNNVLILYTLNQFLDSAKLSFCCISAAVISSYYAYFKLNQWAHVH